MSGETLVELCERLRATEMRETYFTTSRTSPPTKGEYPALINPDGPAAADLIEQLQARLAEAEGEIKGLLTTIADAASDIEVGRQFRAKDDLDAAHFRTAASWLAGR